PVAYDRVAAPPRGRRPTTAPLAGTMPLSRVLPAGHVQKDSYLYVVVVANNGKSDYIRSRRASATVARRPPARRVCRFGPRLQVGTAWGVPAAGSRTMHIPDGYLSPASAGALYVTSVPFWAIAVSRVRSALRGRTVPLLAVFSAFSFAIMMFNVPVPGGTTAHGVGGTLAAIVIGPWAAVLSTSVALIIQALFFGDGGITAIGANCFNMAVMLPLSGYTVYRLLSGRSDPLAQRRVIADAIGASAGITIAALLVG